MPVLRQWTPSIGERLEDFQAAAGGRPGAMPSRPAGWRDRIEIVVPAYDHAEFLPDAYCSILEQTWKERVALTFVDDNSSDRTAGVLREIEHSHPDDRFDLSVIRNRKNLRQWASINRAVRESDNELFVILNDDDMLMADCLEKTVATYEVNPDLYMLGGSSLWFDEATAAPPRAERPLGELELRRYGPEDAVGFSELNDLNLTHSSSSFFKAAWSAVGGYFPKRKRIHPRANEDRDFQMRVSALFPVGVYVDYPFAYWRTDSSHGQTF
jgi:glycosyltransferase involved in cell wall biosynthesis